LLKNSSVSPYRSSSIDQSPASNSSMIDFTSCGVILVTGSSTGRALRVAEIPALHSLPAHPLYGTPFSNIVGQN
jgi:hypothetical protein